MPEQRVSHDKTTLIVMRALQKQPDMSQRDLAQRAGISLGSLHYCLKALMDKGFVKLENFQNSQHKLKYAYILTPAGMAEKFTLTSQFLQRKVDEYEALKVEIEALKAEVGKEKGDGSRKQGS